MAYEGFNVASEKHSKSSGVTRIHIIVGLVTLVIGIGAGILIGHFAIEKGSKESATDGRAFPIILSSYRNSSEYISTSF